MEAGDWLVEAVEVIRGDEAWQRVQSANSFNDPPMAGNEYALVLVRARYTGKGEGDIDQRDFWITGSRGRADRVASVVDPGPELDYTMQPGGEAEGWITFEVGESESQLMLIFDVDSTISLFLALEPDAKVRVDAGSLSSPNNAGLSRADPAAVGETLVTEELALTVLDQLRGDDAFPALVNANQFNDPPPDGFQYVSLLIQVQSVSSADTFNLIWESDFKSTGDSRVLYNTARVVDPEPQLDFQLFPGATAQGWVTLLAPTHETGLMLRFDKGGVRFLALDEMAGVPVAAKPLAEPTDLGVERDSPIPFGAIATNEKLEVHVLEVVRGETALAMARNANQFNDEPEQGMEYLQVRVSVRNISAGEEYILVDDGWFATIGSRSIIWDNPAVVEPEPRLRALLYSGGVWEGWVTLQAAVDETDVLLVLERPYGGGGRRYLALS